MGRPAVLKIDIISDLNSRGLDQTDKALRQVGRGAQVAATAIGVGLAAGAVKAVRAASDLGESTNAVSKVFGSAADTVTDFGSTAATQVGLSQAAFQTLATSTGSLLTNFGYSQQQAADATTELATRAADMASVFNTDVDQALNAINAGLRGESEPLRAFGINLNDAALKAKALELGLYAGTGALDSNARAAAAQALIMEQSAAVAGDFQDTSDGLANRQRILTASLEDTAASLGTALLPAAESAVGVLQQLATWASQNQGAVKALAAAAAGFAAVVLGATAAVKAYQGAMLLAKAAQQAWTIASKVARTAQLVLRASVVLTSVAIQRQTLTTKLATAAAKAWAIAQRVLNMALRANPIGLVVTLIAALIAGLVTAYKRSETFRRIVDSVASVIRNAFVGAFRLASDAVSTLVNWLRSAWQWVSNLIGKVRDLFNSGLGKIGNLVGGIFGRSASSAPAAYSASPRAPQLRAVTSAGVSRVGTQRTNAPTIVIQGALDPDAVARQVRRLLQTHDRRTGRAFLPRQAGAI